MAYPNLVQSLDGDFQALNGRQLDRATNGKPKVRQFFSSTKRTFTVVHPGLTSAQKATFEAFYAANGLAAFDFVWQGDGQTYSCLFGAEDPLRKRLPGNRWDITVNLVEA